jgi:UDP-N-acetylmuramyl pentapeptide phosphotransferase/UDP-N-acetylglucosamine-1-phosphate transferase
MTIIPHDLIAALVIIGISTIATSFTRRICERVGFVYRPKADRWNRRVVSLGGGIAMQTAILIGIFLFGGLHAALVFGPPLIATFILGLVDDFRNVMPFGKLSVQAGAAFWVIAAGYSLPLGPIWISGPITLVWLLGMTNSFNIIDNIDGLAAGAMSICGLGLYLLLRSDSPDRDSAMVALVTGSAAIGFLFHNFNPAKIFMGDAGSLPTGFLLSVIATKVRLSGRPNLYSLIPITLVMAIPLMDTLLVSLGRTYTGRSVMQGGRDHSSHRLVALGVSEKATVLLLYAVGAIGLGTAIASTQIDRNLLAVTIATYFLVIFSFVLFLLEVPVYLTIGKRPGAPINWAFDALPRSAQSAISLVMDILAIFTLWKVCLFLFGGTLRPNGRLTLESSAAFATVIISTMIYLIDVPRAFGSQTGKVKLIRLPWAVGLGTATTAAVLAVSDHLNVGAITFLMIHGALSATTCAVFRFANQMARGKFLKMQPGFGIATI